MPAFALVGGGSIGPLHAANFAAPARARLARAVASPQARKSAEPSA